MSKINLFLDSSALFAGIISPTGAARVLLLLGEAGQVGLMISEQVVVETERALARKLPSALNDLGQAILSAQMQIVRDPIREQVREYLYVMKHLADIPILVAAMQAQVDYLVTLNRRHFIDDPEVARQSGLRIGTPGDALAWIREQLAK
jgi:predicted nucleic acid-binding protein